MLNKTKERIAIFFNEKSEARKAEICHREAESMKHLKMLAGAEELTGRTSYDKILKSESEQNWRA